MPGLLRGVARTAVAAGTFTAVSNRVSRRQGKRWSQQDAQQNQQAPPQYQQAPPQYQQAPPQYQQPAQAPQYYQQPAPAPAAAPDPIAQLKELAELKNQGILTEEEFAAQKAKLLA
jgi:Short C-terminal domain